MSEPKQYLAPLYSSVDDIQTVAIVAAIVRAADDRLSIQAAVDEARRYLTAAKLVKP